MTVSELIGTCQNIWNKDTLFSTNKKFQVEIITDKTKETYYWKELKEKENYILNLRKKEVAWWEMWEQNKITICID